MDASVLEQKLATSYSTESNRLAEQARSAGYADSGRTQVPRRTLGTVGKNEACTSFSIYRINLGTFSGPHQAGGEEVGRIIGLEGVNSQYCTYVTC